MDWIKAKDRLPTKEELKECDFHVLIYDLLEGVRTCYYMSTNQFNYPYYGQDLSGEFENVTHWTIPDKPKT